MTTPEQLRLTDEERAAYSALVTQSVPIKIDSLIMDKLLTVLYEQNAAIHALTTTLYHSITTGVIKKSDVDEATSKAGKSLDHIHGILKTIAVGAAGEKVKVDG